MDVTGHIRLPEKNKVTSSRSAVLLDLALVDSGDRT